MHKQHCSNILYIFYAMIIFSRCAQTRINPYYALANTCMKLVERSISMTAAHGIVQPLIEVTFQLVWLF